MSDRSARVLDFGAPAFPLAVLLSLQLVDQARQSAFNLLIPNVRDAFNLTDAGILLIVALAQAAALGCTIPVALLADRTNRVRILLIGAALGAVFALGLGFAPTALLAGVALAGMSMGQASIFPTHNSLLADYYPVRARPRVYYAHRAGFHIGAIAGVLVGAGLTAALTWRAPIVGLALPSIVLVMIGLHLREPPRGHHEQAALAEGVLATDMGGPGGIGEDSSASRSRPEASGPSQAPEVPPSFGEAWRMVWKIGVLRRIFYALPMLATGIAGFASLATLQYQQTFHLDATERAFLVAPVQVFDVLGVLVGALVASRLAATGMHRVFNFLAVAAVVAAGFAVLFALAPSVPVAFVANAGIEGALAVVAPGVLAALSLAIPARARSMGFSIGALFVLPGLAVLPAIGAIGDQIGFRYGLLLMVPVFVTGALIVASAGSFIDRDLRNVWTSIRTRAQMLADRRAGRLPLLAVRDLSVGYDGVTVLEGVNADIAEGEIVAVIGTNGAGKSTLLRAIGGIVEAHGGVVLFDGRDITHAPPDEIARLGIAQVPGGAGVFPALSVLENLRCAAWQKRRTSSEIKLIDGILESLPMLDSRREDRAGDLSGGQQQMLALAMGVLAEPRLLLIDELSLGLAPIVVEKLLGPVLRLRGRGTAVLLVEQSVEFALSVADRAYVMESGTISPSRTSGELRAQPDLLRSVFLRKAVEGLPMPTRSPPDPSRSREPALGVSDVSVSFGGILALDRVRLSVDQGEVLGIIGPNGAGKTTLFDVLSGFVRPSSGSITLHGIDITERSAATRSQLGLGRSFQDSRLFGTLCVREVLAVALERFIDVTDPFNAMLRLPALVDTEAAVRRRVDELLDLFGLDRLADSLLSELSTGSRRLVDLAAVVAHHPDVVLLDEPSSGVAQREVEAMTAVLRRVREQLDATVLVVEHDINFVSELSDRLIAIDRGAVVASGSPSEVLSAPHVGEVLMGSDPRARSRTGVHRGPADTSR